MMNSKKGSAIVEAAVVFPVIILSLLTVIYIFIYFYGHVTKQVSVHSVLRYEAGLISENMYKKDQTESELPVYRQGDRIYCRSIAASQAMGLIGPAEKKIYAEKYIIDETSVVRLADFAEAELEEYE
ncbi:MAG: pilus assembly protein [Firmicutes bacterium]|nr:pilus assembly protein [Bacillota bacterium]